LQAPEKEPSDIRLRQVHVVQDSGQNVERTNFPHRRQMVLYPGDRLMPEEQQPVETEHEVQVLRKGD
jgi:hypothetical protein